MPQQQRPRSRTLDIINGKEGMNAREATSATVEMIVTEVTTPIMVMNATLIRGALGRVIVALTVSGKALLTGASLGDLLRKATSAFLRLGTIVKRKHGTIVRPRPGKIAILKRGTPKCIRTGSLRRAQTVVSALSLPFLWC